jgi:flagellar biosynthesis/type III secretory pathway protein FliH
MIFDAMSGEKVGETKKVDKLTSQDAYKEGYSEGFKQGYAKAMKEAGKPANQQ